MAETSPRPRMVDRLAALLAIGFGLRVVAALVVQEFCRRRGRLCVFPDTDVYLLLARRIEAGRSFEVSHWGVPHYALRTPGYPLFLAGCEVVFGTSSNLLPIRLVQAAIGAGCAWLVYRLVGQVLSPDGDLGRWTTHRIAAVLVTFEPYIVAMSALVLSEAVFVPLMLAALWGMAALWPARGVRPWLALATGAAAGAAILVRPSWVLFVPAMLVVWVISTNKANRIVSVKGAILVVLGVSAVMAPWWIRNARVFGRFVPTALWAGPSLYDGLSPRATGASDMEFLNEPEVRRLDESSMDATLMARAWDFARARPGRALRLAAIKTARFWSPWPNADEVRNPVVALASALVTIPLYALLLLGAWDRRRDVRALTLMAGPLLYFWAVHTLFVGSVRYRIPGSVPAMGLAAIGARRLWGRRSAEGHQPSAVSPQPEEDRGRGAPIG